MGIDTSVLRQNEKTLTAILQMKSFGFESQSTPVGALGGNGLRIIVCLVVGSSDKVRG